jgi:hypothetical protein
MTLDSPLPLPEPAPPVLRFDWQDWLPYFEDESISEEQKRVLIETIWAIVIGFVDLGWSTKPTLEASALENSGVGNGDQNCGQTIDLKAVLEAAVVRSELVDKGKEAS